MKYYCFVDKVIVCHHCLTLPGAPHKDHADYLPVKVFTALFCIFMAKGCTSCSCKRCRKVVSKYKTKTRGIRQRISANSKQYCEY